MGFTDIIAKGIEVAGNVAQSKVDYERQKKLMDIQQSHQMELNKQGQEIQLDTWNKTNYPAQVGMLKEAGLNPGLLYAKGGSGGTTGSQGGGSASSGQAPRSYPMDLMNVLSLKQAEANISLTKAQENKTNVEANKISGVDTTESESRIKKIIAETQHESLKSALVEIETDLKQIEASKRPYQLQAEIENIMSLTKNINLQNELRSETLQAIISETKARSIGAILENELKTSEISLNETKKQEILTKLVQKWTELANESRSLDQKDMELKINKFAKEQEAEYPGMMEVAGMVLKKAYKSLESLISFQNFYENQMSGSKDKIK